MENIEEIKDDMFIGFNEKGEKTTFYKLLEFDSTETGKHYLAYTDNSVDEKVMYVLMVQSLHKKEI